VRRHVDLLALLYVVGGALSVLTAAGLALLALGALSIRGNVDGENAALAAGVTALALGIVAVTLGAWGGASVLAGRALRRMSAAARHVCLALAVLNLFLLPFGTALGIYTLWVLLHHDARRLFTGGAGSERRRPAGV
jgi:hypothetical protein